MQLPESTLVGMETGISERSAAWGRRAVLAVLAVLVLAGGLGLLGVHTTTDTATEGDWQLSVQHAVVARAGLDVPWVVTVRHPGGFGKTVTIAVTADYFDIYETQGFEPQPSSEVRDGDTRYLTFDTAPGDTFRVSYDAYVQPSSQQGRDATVSVMDQGVAVASVHISTHLLP